MTIWAVSVYGVELTHDEALHMLTQIEPTDAETLLDNLPYHFNKDYQLCRYFDLSIRTHFYIIKMWSHSHATHRDLEECHSFNVPSEADRDTFTKWVHNHLKMADKEPKFYSLVVN